MMTNLIPLQKLNSFSSLFSPFYIFSNFFISSNSFWESAQKSTGDRFVQMTLSLDSSWNKALEIQVLVAIKSKLRFKKNELTDDIITVVSSISGIVSLIITHQ